MEIILMMCVVCFALLLLLIGAFMYTMLTFDFREKKRFLKEEMNRACSAEEFMFWKGEIRELYHSYFSLPHLFVKKN